VAGHTSDVPAQECTQLGEQIGGIRSLWAALELSYLLDVRDMVR